MVRDEKERFARIVEQKDTTPEEHQVKEINSGIYAFDLDGLFDSLRGIAAENAQREYYLPDLVQIYRQRGRGVETVTVDRIEEIQGINSRVELAAVSRVVRDAKNSELMAAGVTLEDPATTYVDRDVTIGADTIVHPGVSIDKSGGVRATYGWLTSISVAEGDLVEPGTVVGVAGERLMFTLRRDGEYFDPAPHVGRLVRRPWLVSRDGASREPPPARLACPA